MSAQTEKWRARRLTAEAILALLLARAVVAAVPFRIWRRHVGFQSAGSSGTDGLARRLALQVMRGADRLGLPLKCLPRAIALSWMLRRRGLDHELILAARPAALRGTGDDDLHAWIEADGAIAIGEIDGPWIEIQRLRGT